MSSSTLQDLPKRSKHGNWGDVESILTISWHIHAYSISIYINNIPKVAGVMILSPTARLDPAKPAAKSRHTNQEKEKTNPRGWLRSPKHQPMADV
jgi:hypothetical protein